MSKLRAVVPKEKYLSQTRVPQSMYRYLRIIAALRDESSARMYAYVVSLFLEERPWEHGFPFRVPKAVKRMKKIDPWMLLGMPLEKDLYEKVKDEAMACRVSVSAFLFSALCWWCLEKNNPGDLHAGQRIL
jgi:hypothetical protein